MYGIPTGREGRVRVLLYVTACGTCSTSSDDNPQGQLYIGAELAYYAYRLLLVRSRQLLRSRRLLLSRKEPRDYSVHS